MDGKKRMGPAEGYRRWNGLIFGLLALAVVLWVLLAGDGVGLSNNGDFSRVMGASSLSYGERIPSHTYADAYAIDLSHGSWSANLSSILFGTAGLRRYPSLHVPFVRLSVAVNLAVNKVMGWEMSIYHIQVLGCMYALLYAAAIGLLCYQIRLRRLWADALVKCAALVVLCDVGYVAYFNSFYGEALEHIMLVFCTALLLRALGRLRPTVWDGAWCAPSAVGYGWAKFFNIPLAILLAVVMSLAVYLRGGEKRRVLAMGGGAAAVLLAVWAMVPSWMDIETNYNAVFFGVVRGQNEVTARRYMADLGLPAELSDYRDTNYYMDGLLPELEERGLREAAESVGKGDLLRFYLTHPGRLWEQAQITALHCGMVRPWYLANYGAGYPPMSYTGRMSLWSGFRDWLALDTVWGNFAAIAAFMVLAVLAWGRRTRPLWLALPLLALLGGLAYAYLLPVMLNGEGDFAKHMFAYIEIADLLLLACLALALDGEGRAARSVGGMMPWVRPAVGGALALALILPPLAGRVQAVWQSNAVHDGLEPGAYVTLGSYEGQPLTWLVAEEEDGGFTLLCVQDIACLPFDEGGSNVWLDSGSREWLNGAFLAGFSPEERALLSLRRHEVLLPDSRRNQAEAGEVFFSCSHIAELSDRDEDRAWRVWVEDTVCLPSIGLTAELARQGYGVSGDYWLETPYCPSDALVRRMGEDGHIYFSPTDTLRGVRPVVNIRAAQPVSGRGSRNDPFVLCG